MPTIDLSIGPIDYRVLGPGAAGAPVAVFVHGFLVNSTLWDPVAEKLAADGVRCILPDWPLGAHRRPADPAPACRLPPSRAGSPICLTHSACTTSSLSAATPAALYASSRCVATRTA